MSQRGLKARIATLLAKRDYGQRLLGSYDAVIADMVLRGAFPDQFEYVRLMREAQARDVATLQDAADRLASDLRTPKTSFSGLQLHARFHQLAPRAEGEQR